MTVLDISLVNVALPVMAAEFKVSESATVWVVTIYQLIIVMLLLPLSFIGDQFSYRRNFITGIVVFTIGSILCALSFSYAMLIVARAIQALGAAGVMSVNVALTRIIYPRNILGRGLALNAMFIAIASATGPSLAGWILSVASWKWLFLINVPLGIVGYFIARHTLPHNPVKHENPHLDITGTFMNILIFGSLFLGLGNLGKGDGNITGACLIAVSVVLSIYYVRRQSHLSTPILPVDLFHIRLYTLSIITSVCSFIAQNIALIALPFLFLTGLHFSELHTGLAMTPWPLATMIVSPLAARWIEHHNPAFTAATGMIIFCGGVVSLMLLPSDPSLWNLLWRTAMCGVGFGLFQTPNNIVMVMATPVERTGAAGGMQSTARLTGQTFGSTLVTILFAVYTTLSSSIKACFIIAIVFAAFACILSLDRGRQIVKHHTTL